MIEVLVVAAYPTVRAGLRALLEEATDCAIVGQAASFAEAAELAARFAPRVALVDAGSARGHELGDLAALADEQPDLGLVVLADAGAERYLPPLGRGRVGYLPRDAGPDAILQAVRAVAAGLVVLDPRAAPSLTATPRLALDAPAEPLTAREQEVLALMAQGLPNKTIAQRLVISEHTVKFHVGAILAKLGAASRTEAVTLAARQGLLML
ncbi:MAG TPA: response regulator transcription factor [Chloroflexota bacterium]|nr:response regulator transcription factor [Chloroflexota bacterium]